MKLRNFLGMPETRIEDLLRRRGFVYIFNYDNNNYIWYRSIEVNSINICELKIYCDLKNYKIIIDQAFLNNEHKSSDINIPTDLINDDNWVGFIDWLDETCKPYFGDSEGN